MATNFLIFSTMFGLGVTYAFVSMPPGFGRNCTPSQKFTDIPVAKCPKPNDPKKKSRSLLANWFTEKIFNDLFPKSNLGVGPSNCLPYNYDAFIIAANYFPNFGVESPENGFTKEENNKRDLAAFLAHVIQETGENDIGLYSATSNKNEADDCFYRGAFFNWFEGGPQSPFLPHDGGKYPKSGRWCNSAGQYCSTLNRPASTLWPCNEERENETFKGCYFGRGALQISYEYNYGQFQDWLIDQGYTKQQLDLLSNPNLIIESTSPPLAMMASLWFYMTPQPPKPAIHDIVLGQWKAGPLDSKAGFSGPIFGPSSLVINAECGGEDEQNPGGPGESRRIKAFKWFCKYFGVPHLKQGQSESTLSCKSMKNKYGGGNYNVSWQPDWKTTWKDDQPCRCAPAAYEGLIHYYEEGYFPNRFVQRNKLNEKKCQIALYKNPQVFNLPLSEGCLNVKLRE